MIFSCMVQAVSVAVAALIGIIFLAVQYLASKGVLDIKWNKVEELAVEVLDLNKDGYAGFHKTSASCLMYLTAVRRTLPRSARQRDVINRDTLLWIWKPSFGDSERTRMRFG